MLIGVAPCISPDLLAALDRMGHGDEIVLADANFPGESTAQRVLRADGVRMTDLLDGILALINLDTFVDTPLVMMAPSAGDDLDPALERTYRAVIDTRWPGTPGVHRIDRFAFYERARKAFCVVMTGETARYANLILKKGVIPA